MKAATQPSIQPATDHLTGQPATNPPATDLPIGPVAPARPLTSAPASPAQDHPTRTPFLGLMALGGLCAGLSLGGGTAQAQFPLTSAPIAQSPIAQSPIAQSPIAQSPIAQAPIAQTRIAQTRTAQVPMVQTRIAQSRIAQAQLPFPTPLPDAVSASVLRNLATQTQRPLYSFRVNESQPVNWPDSCLGMGTPGLLCSQVVVSGWRVLVTDDQERWSYRTNGTGSLVQLEYRQPLLQPRPAARVIPAPGSNPSASNPSAARQIPAQVGSPGPSGTPSPGLNASRPARPLARPLAPRAAAGRTQPPGDNRPALDSATTAPLPAQRQLSSAMVSLDRGTFNVRLTNRTNALIDYQVIDDTASRTLGGKTSTGLQALRAPVSLTFRRRDHGLLEVYTQTSVQQPGVLEIYFDATTDLGVDRTTLTVEPNGAVFLN